MRMALTSRPVLLTLLAGACTSAPLTTQANNPSREMAGGGAAAGTTIIRYKFEPGEITKLCDASLAKARAVIDGLKKLPDAQKKNFKKNILVYDNALADLSDEAGPLTFMGYVSEDEKLREEGSACEEKLGLLFPEIQADKALYQTLKLSRAKNSEQKRLVTETLRVFEKNGMNLSDEKLAQLKALKQDLSTLQTKFSANLNNDVSTLTLKPEELDGCSEAFLARLKKTAAGEYVVTTKSTDYVQVMESAKSPETRKAMLLAYLNKAATENTKLLEDAILLRQKIAAMLGYKTWADLQLDGRMAKNTDTVLQFLNNLKGKLSQRNGEDIAQLLEQKKKGDATASAINHWDIAFYTKQLKEARYSLDDEKISEYFPADYVMKGLFETYSKLLNVKYVEVKNANVWSAGVKLYEIRDLKSNKLLAYFYADTIPRPGKYGHAAAFSLINGRMLKKAFLGAGRYSVPVSSIVANFTPPVGAKPSLLLHDEVETLFHEFGHIMHQTLTTAPFASLAGTSVSQDFVEAPSQMLENWVWDKTILKKISRHYSTGETLPDDLIQKMLDAKRYMMGYQYTRQLLFGLFDMTIHQASGAVDVTKTYNDLFKEMVGIDHIEGGHFPATFGHLMGGYDAGYYGYLWSEVYAQDMFSRFEKEGLLSSKTGGSYRHVILERGNMEDALTLISRFLGRAPNADAFYKKLGIPSASR